MEGKNMQAKLTRKNEVTIPESRRNNFNIIRFFAALLVMYGHMFHIVGMLPKTLQHTSVSSYGVLLLFAMGGYLIATSWNSDPHVFRYAVRRVTRLFPAYIVLLLVTVFCLGPLVTSLSTTHYYEWGALNYLWSNLRLYIAYALPGVFETVPYANVVNGSLWTMPVEAALYILAVVVLVIAGKKAGKRRDAVLIGSAVLMTLTGWGVQLLMNAGKLDPIVFYATDLRQCAVVMPYFFVGMVYTLPQVRRFLNMQAAFVLMAVVMLFEFPLSMSPFILYYVMPYIMFSFAFAPTPVFYKFGSKSDITFGMYLYGFPVQQLVVYFASVKGLPISFWPVFIISVVLTALCALLSWHLVEKPANALAKKIILWSKNRDR